MIMLLIMGNFEKENLSSSELNCFCFYINVGYFFTPFKILYLSVERRDGWIIQELICQLIQETDAVAQIDEVILPFNHYWKHLGKFYLQQNNLFARAQKKKNHAARAHGIQHVRLKSLLIFCTWICFSFYLAKHSCVSIAMNSRNSWKGEMPEATAT